MSALIENHENPASESTVSGAGRPCLRPALGADLEAINTVITSAIGTWQVTERVRRQSLRVHCYDAVDLAHLHTTVAVVPAGVPPRALGKGAGKVPGSDEIVGVATLEPADTDDLPAGNSGLLLHGLYVHRDYHGKGVGRALLCRAAAQARALEVSGVLVKAAADSVGFFRHQGLEPLPVEDLQRDYPHRFWLPV